MAPSEGLPLAPTTTNDSNERKTRPVGFRVTRSLAILRLIRNCEARDSWVFLKGPAHNALGKLTVGSAISLCHGRKMWIPRARHARGRT